MNNQRAMERKLENCFRLSNIQLIGAAERKKGETEKEEIIKEIQFPGQKDLSHHIVSYHDIPNMKMRARHYKISEQ